MSKKFLRTISIFFLGIIMLIQLTGCSGKHETVIVNAQVTNKEYIDSHLEYGYHYDMLYDKFRFMYKMVPAEYNITVQYTDITKTFDSKSLYDTYEVGNSIEVDLTIYYDSDGIVTSRYISRRN